MQTMSGVAPGRDALLLAALIAGASYFPASFWLTPGAALVAWKGAGVALLAVWALVRGRSVATRWIAVVLAFGALGDVLLDALGLTTGAIAFLIGHLVATILYLRHRTRRGRSDLLALPILVAAPGLASILPGAGVETGGIALYAFCLGLMVSSAWISGFRRDRVAMGALMFVVSDWLIFARLGPLAGSMIPSLLIWPLYFGGQALIAVGVVASGRAENHLDGHEDLHHRI